MTLASIIEADFGTQKAFARASGLDEGQLSKYLASERGEKGQRPNADNIARIEKATDGRITASHWSGIRGLRSSRHGTPPAAP